MHIHTLGPADEPPAVEATVQKQISTSGGQSTSSNQALSLLSSPYSLVPSGPL